MARLRGGAGRAVPRRVLGRRPAGAYPALALDGESKPVDSLTSNIGHLLGTGILTPAEEALVADLLGAPALAGGFGLRTMAADDAAFSPLATTAARSGRTTRRSGRPAGPGRVRGAGGDAGVRPAGGGRGVRLPAARALRRRRPGRAGVPVPYPAACRPQAWAAAGRSLVTALTGLEPDAPQGRLRLAPLRPAPFGDLRVRGLRVRGELVEVDVDADGQVRDVRAPDWLDVDVR